MRTMSRRALLASTFTAAAGAGACAGTNAAAPGTAPSSAADPAVSLNARARRKGMFFGSAVGNDTLTNDPDALARVDVECGMVVGEAAFKWADVHPEADKYDFSRADGLMTWATHRGLRVRGHTLAWHEGNPEWLEATLRPGNAEKILTGHIRTVAGRYAKHLAHWDVVNEPINLDDKKPHGLRNSPWFRALGPAYLDIAFHAAAAADPGALRVLNEFGVDYAIPWQDRKRGALLELLADLTHRKVPIQAVGLQAHLDAGELALDQNALSRMISDINAMGLKVIVTELDVRDQRLPADPEARDIAVASHAHAWLEAVLPNPAVLGVLSWGLSDRRSWLNDKFPRPDGLAQRPLPLDANLNRKRLWGALAAAFDTAPAREALASKS